MKTEIKWWLTLLVMVLMAHAAKKPKKDRKAGPQWKSSSMPAMNKKTELIIEGKAINLDCKAQASPKPSIKWLKDGVEIKNNNNMQIKKFNLVLKALTTNMTGNYTCVVSNKHGQIDWTFHLSVPEKISPLIIDGPRNMTQVRGSTVTFRCQVLNDQRATIRWMKTSSKKNMDDNVLQPEFLPGSEDPHILTLNNIQTEDEGEYRCMAGNVFGLNYSSAWLTVIDTITVAQSPHLSEMDKNYGNTINNNNVIQSEPSGSLDPNVLTDVKEDDIVGSIDSDGMNPSEYDDLDPDFTTTKQPKNTGNKRKKNGLKKERKDKPKNRVEEDLTSSSAFTSLNTSPATTTEVIFTTTFPEIWQFKGSQKSDDFGDSRYNPVKTDEMADVDNTDSTMSAGNESIKGSISSWTIYTIVGAIGGVVLLIGLLAITLTLCCKKDDSSVYKPTSI